MKKKLGDLKIGDIIEKDIWKGDILLLKEGSQITKPKLDKLKRWGVTSIGVTRKTFASLQAPPNFQPKKKNKITIYYGKNQLIDHEVKLRKLFLETLTELGHDYRYGHALQNPNTLKWLEESFLTTISNTEVLELMMELKEYDPYSYHHSIDVFMLSSLLAKRLDYLESEEFSIGTMLHDIGKTLIPTTLLNKVDTLSDFEFHIIKSHAIEGYNLLRGKGFPKSISSYCRTHHERLDGSGYPKGLKAKSLTPYDRILMIADTYCALTSNRPYRTSYTANEALLIMLGNSEQFDPTILQQLMLEIGVFPVGSVVSLSNGKMAKVVEINDYQPFASFVTYLEGLKDSILISKESSLSITSIQLER
ncbi:HD-GYP domain-containing protein [Pseudalkalibacillus hwajinpoensis]|uniref:HD-GYP domain-containing protein n=1 Tax=Guptibacillus hwajinpoensis TaxID=208199 RepID=UPI001CD6101A|nr:HD domain-containing phosphohydrolase [Pseudalkalibacillus hwajinpoensis]MCA0991450.1 HD domain-containing protein [Pseudalkalibacillus hwajinpoensis]